MWCTAERREICLTCLSKKSIPAIPFWISKPPIPPRSLRLLRAAARCISSALCLHHAHPFIAAEDKKTSLMQRSKGFGHGVVVSKICYVIYSVSKIWITGYWLCSQLWHVAAANQWTIVKIELLETLGWKCGCQPFSRRCSLNVMHCRKKRDLFDMFV